MCLQNLYYRLISYIENAIMSTNYYTEGSVKKITVLQNYNVETDSRKTTDWHDREATTYINLKKMAWL